jgi:hypothetical protein
VLEIALVRLARRDAGPPLQALADRVERLERGTPAALAPSPTDVAEPQAAADAPPRERPSFAELKQAARRVAPASPPDAPPTQAAPPDPTPAPADESASAVSDVQPVELDDVILVWSEILPSFPPATRATAQEAQPIAVVDDVITFGVPKNLIGSARERFRREADNIRAALTDRLGRRLMFKLEPIDGFGVLPAAPAPGRSDGEGSESDDRSDRNVPTALDEPPTDDEDDFDFTQLVDAVPVDAAVDSVGLLTSQFDATVVEERPRD